jgi:hypothetical protein
MYQNVVALGFISNANPEEFAATDAKITATSEKINALLDRFLAEPMTEQEKLLADRYVNERKEFVAQVIKPAQEMAKNGNIDDMRQLLAKNLHLFQAVVGTNAELVEVQLQIGSRQFNEAKAASLMGSAISLAIIAAGIIMAFAASKYLGKLLAGRLGYLDSRLNSISGGNNNTDIKVGDDELQNIMISVKALQAKIAYAELEKKELDRQKKEMQ